MANGYHHLYDPASANQQGRSQSWASIMEGNDDNDSDDQSILENRRQQNSWKSMQTLQ